MRTVRKCRTEEVYQGHGRNTFLIYTLKSKETELLRQRGGGAQTHIRHWPTEHHNNMLMAVRFKQTSQSNNLNRRLAQHSFQVTTVVWARIIGGPEKQGQPATYVCQLDHPARSLGLLRRAH